MIQKETCKLSNDASIPELGLETRFIDDDKAAQACRDAVDDGYRHIDTTEAYGNERGVGEGVRDCGLARNENFVTTKPAAEMVFPIGTPNDAYARYFIGQSYLAPISTSQINISNVTFEPGCRNNWHIHHADTGGGQILICVAGRGYYQEWGKAPVEMRPGDCVNIPANVKHWHGAAPDSWFSHLAIEVPGTNSSNEWLEPVDDSQYRF